MKTKMTPQLNICRENRLASGLFFDPSYDCNNGAEVLIVVESDRDRVLSTPVAVLCFSWNEVTPKWITKEKGKVPFVSRSL